MMILMKKVVTLLTTAALLCSVTAGSVFAFNDIDSPEQKESIMTLKSRGIVSGVDAERYAPKNKISFAQSIQLLVKGLDLNIDHIRFIKKPEASDYFTTVANDAWYAEAFIIAHLNGLSIPKDVDPNGTITREQFAHLLIQAIDTKGSFPVIKMLINLKDADQVDPQYNYSLQRLFLHKLSTPIDGMAYPKREITRGEAAVWVHNAIKFVESHTEKPAPAEEVQVTVEKVSEEVNKVTLSRGEKPSSGYTIAITGIRFEDDKAYVQYTVTDPKPDMSYLTVITEPKAVTYVSAKYQPVAEAGK
jgi:hypothetical protein